MLAEERGWSKTALSGAAALQQMEAALLGPVLGWLLDRFGPQVFIRAGVFFFGGGLMLLSTVDSLAGFYAAFVVIALGGSLAGFFPLNVALIHWFERFRARALSSMSLGLALGGIATPLVAWSLQTYGWRPTAFCSGVLAIVIGFPLAMVMRNRPEDYGLKVDGLPERTSAEDLERTIGGTPRPVTRDFTAREALRTPRVLAALARPRLRPVHRAHGAGARHHAPQGRPGLLDRHRGAGDGAGHRASRSSA